MMPYTAACLISVLTRQEPPAYLLLMSTNLFNFRRFRESGNHP